MILGVPLVKKTLFEIEKLIFIKKNNLFEDGNHVFITGLPRSGTTIILEFLYSSEEFASLTYSDVPFVMAPNFSKIFLKKKKLPKKLRIHDDRIEYDLDSPEAFDEVFFNLSKKTDFEDYKKFVYLIIKKYKKNKYLSKNNNNYKRINLINSAFKNSKILITYRDPLQHACSLLNQHKRFLSLQKKNKFILSYMNYLGHHEFGLNYKFWNKPIKFHDKLNVNHWLEQWYFFYKNILEKKSKFKNTILINYDKFCSNEELQNKLLGKINLSKNNLKNIFQVSPKKNSNEYDKENLKKCSDIYEKLNLEPINLSNLSN